MITTAEASERIRAALRPRDAEQVSLGDAGGRVLAQTIVAERDQPPFDRVMMDGIAIRYADFAAGNRTFAVQGVQAAGDTVLALEPGSAIEIMTGASLPAGADCIVPIERVTINDYGAHVEANYQAEKRQFIHARGSDHHQGATLLEPGRRITPMDIAVIASCGLATIEVASRPTISVVSTGNELVPAGQPIADHQVRLSNGPALVAMLEAYGFKGAEHEHLVDDETLLEKRIGALLECADVMLLSGGVSMGKADFVPEVMRRLGVRVEFHKISQRPGKPMWFGIGPDGQPVFALPGNPVSALVCCRQYVIPSLEHMTGMTPPLPQFATLTRAVTFEPQLTNFLPVRVVCNTAGQLLAMPVFTNTSGDFASLSGTDGYVELALEQSHFAAGSTVPLHRWHS